MIKLITASWIVFCLILSGCAQLAPKTLAVKPAPQGEPVPVITRPALTDMLLKFIQTFNALSADLQKKEVANINTQPRTEYSRMQLALIAGLPGSRSRDIARAQLLIDEHLKAPDSKDEGLRNLAMILKKQLAEQQKLLAEQQKLEETIPSLTQKFKDEQKKSETLQQKLDELLAVEKAMTERNRAQPR
jgi:hypothetical protein